MNKMMRMTLMTMLAVMALPVMAQEVEVTSVQRLHGDNGQPAYYPVLNPTGDRLLYQTDNDGMKMYDMSSGQVTTITTDVVSGPDVCWGGDGKVYYVSLDMDENKLIYRSGNCYDTATEQVSRLIEPQHGAMRAVPAKRGAALRSPSQNYKSPGDIGDAAWTEGSRVHVMVGGDEFERGNVRVRDLSTREEREIALQDAAKEIRSLLS